MSQRFRRGTTRGDCGDLLEGRTHDDIAHQSRPDTTTPLKPWIRPAKRHRADLQASNWKALHGHSEQGSGQAELYDAQGAGAAVRYEHNIENYVGTLRVPVGGDRAAAGSTASSPRATTTCRWRRRRRRWWQAMAGRAADLVGRADAPRARWRKACSARPGFALNVDATEAGLFVAWVCANFEMLKEAAAKTTRHGKLVELSPHVEGDHVYLKLTYTTGDAAGQNMVTIATASVCEAIIEHSRSSRYHWFVEANFSGDKKASAMSFVSVRGRKVTASVELPGEEIRKQLHTTPEAHGGLLAHVGAGRCDVRLHRRAGHYANGLAALYLGDRTGCGLRGGERRGRHADRNCGKPTETRACSCRSRCRTSSRER